jgi:hypothetical protein
LKSLRTKIFRCAISTRKSTEHNLDLEFNSLDAQREAYEWDSVPASRLNPRTVANRMTGRPPGPAIKGLVSTTKKR